MSRFSVPLLMGCAMATLSAPSPAGDMGDGDYPLFLPWIGPYMNVVQPNADTIYKKALITPGGSYRIRGTIGSLRAVKMAQVNTLPEETGKAVPGIGVLTWNNFSDLTLGSEGDFDVLLSPERPESYRGDWWQLDSEAHALLLRMVSYDWSTEQDPSLSIERVDTAARRDRPSSSELRARLSRLSEETGNMAMLLVDHVAQLREEGELNRLDEMRVNGKKLSEIGGVEGQFYYEGPYEMAEGEALLLEVELPETCHYWSVILTNDIFETIDWYNNYSSINGAQAYVDSDGVFRAVISDEDPGIQNWLDTAGNLSGAIQGRWLNCEGQAPVPKITKMPLTEVIDLLPPETPGVTKAERETLLRERRRNLQLRRLW